MAAEIFRKIEQPQANFLYYNEQAKYFHNSAIHAIP